MGACRKEKQMVVEHMIIVMNILKVKMNEKTKQMDS